MADFGKSFGTGFESGVGLALKNMQQMRLEERRDKKLIEREKRREIDRLKREKFKEEVKDLKGFAKSFIPPDNVNLEEWDSSEQQNQRARSMRIILADRYEDKKIPKQMSDLIDSLAKSSAKIARSRGQAIVDLGMLGKGFSLHQITRAFSPSAPKGAGKFVLDQISKMETRNRRNTARKSIMGMVEKATPNASEEEKMISAARLSAEKYPDLSKEFQQRGTALGTARRGKESLGIRRQQFGLAKEKHNIGKRKANIEATTKYANALTYGANTTSFGDPEVKKKRLEKITAFYQNLLPPGTEIPASIKSIIKSQANLSADKAVRVANMIRDNSSGVNINDMVNLSISDPKLFRQTFQRLVEKPEREVKTALDKARIGKALTGAAFDEARTRRLTELLPLEKDLTTARTGQAGGAKRLSEVTADLKQAQLSGALGMTEAAVKLAGDRMTKAMGGVVGARDQLDRSAVMRAAITSSSFKPGAISNFRLVASQIVTLLGGDPREVPLLGDPKSAEVFDAVSKQMVIGAQKEFKGMVRNKQALKLLIGSVPNLSLTPGGILTLLDIVDRKNNLVLALGSSMTKLASSGVTLTPKLIHSTLNKVRADNRVIDADMLERIRDASKVPRPPAMFNGKDTSKARFIGYAGDKEWPGVPMGQPLWIMPNDEVFSAERE
jgi:hypothetical protein